MHPIEPLAAGRASAGMEDRRFALKRATDAAHRKVEAIIDAAGMFRSQGGYVRYLEGSFAARAAVEDALSRAGAERIWPDWKDRRLAHVIAEDLADLGAARPEPSLLPESFCVRISSRELMGVLYVLEGSALGARVLVDLTRRLGLSGSYGARHLHMQAGDREAWRSFIAAMADAADEPCHDTANTTFQVFADAYAHAAGCQAAG